MRLPAEVGRTIFQIAVFLIVINGLILLLARPEPSSAGFVMSVSMLVVSIAFLALIVLLARISQRKR